MSKVLGILGGMGPLATVTLFQKIVLLTQAKCDQEHIHTIVDSYTAIPDRTAYLIASGENPKSYLIESAKRLEAMGADYLIMPCNTAHYFYQDIIKEINIPFLNMIEETAKNISERFSRNQKIGLLATEGTCIAGVYEKVFNTYNMEIIKPTEKNQQHVTSFIYDIKEGKYNIKLDGFLAAVEELRTKGCDVFILGCTELSVGYELFKIKGNYIDPLEIIAISAINFAGKKVKNSSKK